MNLSKEDEQLLKAVDNAVRLDLAERDDIPTPTQLRDIYSDYFGALSRMRMYAGATISQKEAVNALATKYEVENNVRKRFGTAYVDRTSYTPWLLERQDEIPWYYWERYKKYLVTQQGWEPRVVKVIEDDTWHLLDYLMDPEGGEFKRTGLVVAPVQSGKTANYTGLICRAADAGFKIIVVLAGIHNALRDQTQKRLEEGFVGVNTFISAHEYVGVGKISHEKRPATVTDRKRDFNKASHETLKGVLAKHTEGPWLFVVKKNSKVLEKVVEWMRDNCQDVWEDASLLLIDDEADNASINIKYKRDTEGYDISAINGHIRRMLELFNKRAYVGYTATPFANILIDPNAQKPEYGWDIFPESFIFTLDASSAYFGTEKFFADYDSTKPKYRRYLDDAAGAFPTTRREKDNPVTFLPESLREAVRVFIVGSIVKRIRKQVDDHSTMMVNVTPYTKPQGEIKDLIREYVGKLRNAARTYGAFGEKRALENSEEIRSLRDSWEQEYSDAEYDGSDETIPWGIVQRELYEFLKTVRVIEVNSSSKNENIDYENQIEHVIAVGGYRLSRGLTLEGLIVSYYARNSKNYDTLMQMARWFGYRPKYGDLCRVWMTDEAAEWYSYVADVMEELNVEFDDMRGSNLTPMDYVLNIRQHPDTLKITAVSKMGTGGTVTTEGNLNKKMVETVAFRWDQDAIARNFDAAARLKDAIVASGARSVLLGKGKEEERSAKGYLYRGIPASAIEKFLSDYENCDEKSQQTIIKPVLTHVRNMRDRARKTVWDVFFPLGEYKSPKGEYSLPGGVHVDWERRKPGSDTMRDEKCIIVGDNSRLAGKGAESAGLTDAQYEKAIDRFRELYPADEFPNKQCSDIFYREQRERPLLIIHPTVMKFRNNKTRNGLTDYQNSRLSRKPGDWPSESYEEAALGWTASFPYCKEITEPVEYVYNQAVASKLPDDYEEDIEEEYADE